MEYYNSEIVKMDETNEKIVLDRCTDGSNIGISVTRKALNAKHCNTTSGGHFFMNINCHNIFLLAVVLTTLNLAQSAPLPPPTILVFSITNTNNPLHMVVGDSPHVTTSISQFQGYFDNNAHLINLNYNGQGILYLTESGNTYYVAIDSNNDIKPQQESEIANADMYTFREETTENAQQVRYYLQTGGEKYYLMAASNGNIVALNANDLVLGSDNDTRSRFISIYF